MKRLMTIVLALILLSSCTDATARLKNSNKLLQVGKESITDADIYEELISNYGADAVAAIINDYIYSQLFETEEDFSEQVEMYVTLYQSFYGEEYYKVFGLGSESQFINSLVRDFKFRSILKKYVDSNYESLATTYLPTKLAILQFEDFETAEAALVVAKQGRALEDLAEEFGATNAFDGTPMIYTTFSVLPYEVASYGLYAEKADIVDNPIFSADGKYYIVQVISVDRFLDKEGFSEALLGVDQLSSSAVQHYCVLYDVKYYDSTILRALYLSYPDYVPVKK